jgi:hypothetical protein
MHPIYFSTVEEHLFLLEQLAYASFDCVKGLYEAHEEQSKEAKEMKMVSEFEIQFSDYQDHLITMVSDYLIQCAIRTRIIQDSNDFKTEDNNYCPDLEAYDRYDQIAICHEGNIKLSLRECSNKIIHATKYELVFLENKENQFSYWNGHCHLYGDYKNKSWHIEINIKNWVLAMRWFYEVIKEL